MTLYFANHIKHKGSKMKFKNSPFEDCFNEYWNNNVVTLDNTIRNASLGCDDNIAKLIERYQHHVKNILLNLNRQAYMFEDKEYLQEYKQNTIDQTLEDFSFYAGVYPQHRDVISQSLKALGIELPVEDIENCSSFLMQ